MSSSRRRPRPAKQPWEMHGWLRVAYVQLYAEHPDFQQDLRKLYQRQCMGNDAMLARLRSLWDVRRVASQPDDDWASDYLAGLSELARAWGLHRLGYIPPAGEGRFAPSGGMELLHSWCHMRAYRALEGRDWPTEWSSVGCR